MDTDTLERHLTLIYEAATNPQTWPDVIADIARAIDAKSGRMAIESVAGDVPVPLLTLVYHGMDPEALETYFAYYHRLDIWTEAINRPDAAAFMVSDKVVAQQDYLSSEFYADWGRKHDVVYATGTYLLRDDGLGVRVAFQRGQRQGRFEDDTIAYLNRLRSHMLRAVSLGNRLSADALARQVESQSATSSTPALLAVDAHCRCAYLNAVARNLLTQEPWLSLKQNRLSLGYPEADRQLAAAVRGAAGPLDVQTAQTPGAFLLGGGERPWLIEVSPLRGALLGAPANALSSLAAVMIRPLGGAPQAAARRLRALYALTTTEVDIALSLAEGHAPEQIASTRVRSLHTVRTQIRAVLAKTGFRSVTELAARVHQLGG